MFIFISIITSISLFTLLLYCLTISSSNPIIKSLKLYCILNSVIEIITFSLSLKKIPNLIFFYLLIWVEVIILFYFFKNLLQENYKLKNWILLPIFIIMGFVFYFFESLEVIPAYSRFYESISVFMISIFYYHNELQNPKAASIHKNPEFWFVTGFFLYYGGILFLLLFIKYFSNDQVKFNEIWTIYNLLNIIEYFILIYGLICYRRILKPSS